MESFHKTSIQEANHIREAQSTKKYRQHDLSEVICFTFYGTDNWLSAQFRFELCVNVTTYTALSAIRLIYEYYLKLPLNLNLYLQLPLH